MSGLSSWLSFSGMRAQVLRMRFKSSRSKPKFAVNRFQLRDSGLPRPLDWWLRPTWMNRLRRAPEVRVGAVVEKDLGLVIRLAEGRGELRVVDLPEGDLRIGGPEVHVCAEDVLPELHLQAELEFGLGVLDLRSRVGRFVGLLFLGEVVRVREDVILPVRHDGEPVPAALIVELPHPGKDGGPGLRSGLCLRGRDRGRCSRCGRLFGPAPRRLVVAAKPQGIVVDCRARLIAPGRSGRRRATRHSGESGEQAARNKPVSIHTPPLLTRTSPVEVCQCRVRISRSTIVSCR